MPVLMMELDDTIYQPMHTWAADITPAQHIHGQGHASHGAM
jgi:hypothetical protein